MLDPLRCSGLITAHGNIAIDPLSIRIRIGQGCGEASMMRGGRVMESSVILIRLPLLQ
jgi:hypothetical protein